MPSPMMVQIFDHMNKFQQFLEVLVAPTDSVDLLKYRIGLQVANFAFEVHALKYRGCILRDDERVWKYCPDLGFPMLRFSASLRPRIRQQGQHYHIFIHPGGRKAITLEVSERLSVDDVKVMIGGQVSTQADPRVIFAGRQLENGRTLQDYNIKREDWLNLVLRVPGGGMDFADISRADQMKSQAFSSSAPAWRVVKSGMNIEGKCNNIRCAAKGELVICGVGMKAFSLTVDKCACPSCGSDVTPVTCGFYDCEWSFEGKKTHGLNELSVDWQKAGSNGYKRLEETGNIVSWERLTIVARPKRAQRAPCSSQDCPICMMSITVDGMKTRCGHEFHISCMANWKTVRPRGGCPMCRSPI